MGDTSVEKVRLKDQTPEQKKLTNILVKLAQANLKDVRRTEPLRQFDLCRSQLPDDLFCGVTLPTHLPAPLCDPKRNLMILAGSFSRGQVRGACPTLPEPTDGEHVQACGTHRHMACHLQEDRG